MIKDKKSFNEEPVEKLLGEIIYRETSKPDEEADMALVAECEEALASLSTGVSVSEDALHEKFSAVTGGQRSERRSGKRKKKIRRIMRRISAAAASLVLLFGVSMLALYAAMPSFRSYVHDMLVDNGGDPAVTDEEPDVHEGEPKSYKTFAELLYSEIGTDVNVLLLNDLPIKLMIPQSRSHYWISGNTIAVMIADDDVSMMMEIGKSIDVGDIVKSSKKIELNGMTAHISEDDGVYSSISVYGSNMYYITSDTEEKIMTILGCISPDVEKVENATELKLTKVSKEIWQTNGAGRAFGNISALRAVESF